MLNEGRKGGDGCEGTEGGAERREGGWVLGGAGRRKAFLKGRSSQGGRCAWQEEGGWPPAPLPLPVAPLPARTPHPASLRPPSADAQHALICPLAGPPPPCPLPAEPSSFVLAWRRATNGGRTDPTPSPFLRPPGRARGSRREASALPPSLSSPHAPCLGRSFALPEEDPLPKPACKARHLSAFRASQSHAPLCVPARRDESKTRGRPPLHSFGRRAADPAPPPPSGWPKAALGRRVQTRSNSLQTRRRRTGRGRARRRRCEPQRELVEGTQDGARDRARAVPEELSSRREAQRLDQVRVDRLALSLALYSSARSPSHVRRRADRVRLDRPCIAPVVALLGRPQSGRVGPSGVRGRGRRAHDGRRERALSTIEGSGAARLSVSV